MIHAFFHRYLRVPYRLHVRDNRRVRRPRATLLFIHGIGSSSAEWVEVIKGLPTDVSVVTIDLLGFGESPRPSKALYNAAELARSVMMTLLLTGRTRHNLIVVGHSLGSLVAIELAKKYPRRIASVVLCSPPLYDAANNSKLPNPDSVLISLYERLERYPDQLVKLSHLALKYKLVNAAFNLDTDRIDSYIATLKAAIINQTSFYDALTLRLPITLLYGSLDPVLVEKNLKKLARLNPHVHLTRVMVGHEVIGSYVPKLVDTIEAHIARSA